MELVTTNVKMAATTAATVAPSVLSTLTTGMLLELIASSVCGAAVYMVWAEDVSVTKRVALGGVSAILGVLAGPHVAGSLPWLPEVSYNIGAALVGALGVVTLTGVLKLLADGKRFNAWVDARVAKAVGSRRRPQDDDHT